MSSASIRITRRQRDALEYQAASMTKREIAQALGISIEAVKHRLKRARRATRDSYAHALERDGGKKVTFKPFSLLPTDHI